MGFSEEERQRNLQAIREQVEGDVELFVARHNYDQSPGFTAAELAEFVRYERFDERAAHLALMSLKDDGQVHMMAGRWHSGPLPR